MNPAKREGGTRSTSPPRQATPGKPLISIVTVVFNGAAHLEQAMQSVLSQSYQPIEYIVVDGGSTDGTIELIQRHEARIEHWVSEPDRGISDAMNKGLRLARGEWIAFLHADDYYRDATVVSDVCAALRGRPEVQWLTGGLDIVDGMGRTLQSIPPREYSYSKLVRKNFILHPATFVSRQAMEAAGGFNDAYCYAMDYDLWLRLGKKSAPVKFNRQVACFRAHAGSRSVAGAEQAYAEEWQIRKKLLDGHRLRTGLSYLYYLASKNFVRQYYRKLLRTR